MGTYATCSPKTHATGNVFPSSDRRSLSSSAKRKSDNVIMYFDDQPKYCSVIPFTRLVCKILTGYCQAWQYVWFLLTECGDPFTSCSAWDFFPRTWDGLDPKKIDILLQKGPKRDSSIQHGKKDKLSRRFSTDHTLEFYLMDKSVTHDGLYTKKILTKYYFIPEWRFGGRAPWRPLFLKNSNSNFYGSKNSEKKYACM